MHILSGYLIVFLGAGLGGAARHAVNLIVPRLVASEYPYSTILVNAGGSFFMGLLAGWFAYKGDSAQAWRLFLTTGVLGGFTTFSTFSLDVALLWERGEAWNTAVYVTSSVLLSLCGLFGALRLMRLMQ
ncbi:MAG TPA: fluoride efflux transporter CrcB [Candidatus Binatia bacterium]|nr:fluoride efflux transporter CrcB [Candidatus Binatia bacterium]